MDAYFCKLAAACTVLPNLNDKELQDSYGVMSAEQLLKVMLSVGEYNTLLWKTQEVNQMEISLQDKVDDAKNS